MWSIWRMEFFFTTPNSTRIPRMEYMLRELPVNHNDSRAKGRASGRAISMVTG
jgi:hypothetical protein